MSTLTLGFTLRRAAGMQAVQKVCEVRAMSYGHHMPGLRDALAVPDDIDLQRDTAIFLCEDKLTGEAVGTARIQTSLHGPLLIEQCIEIPARIASQGRAEITRLSAKQGADPLVKLALWKACYLYCQAAQARWMVIGARSEALVKQYRRLGFDDVYADRRTVPLSYAGGVPHRVLAFDVVTAERTAFASNNALYGFIFETTHPDIDLFHIPAASAAPARSRFNANAAATDHRHEEAMAG